MSTGNLAARHGENNDEFSGTKSAATPSSSYMEQQTIIAYQKIKAAAAANDVSDDSIALSFLLTKLDVLENYIRSKGETPSQNNYGVIVQAMLLRMQDIYVVSNAANLSEDDAFAEIQQAESEAILNNTADKDLVMDPDTQAALNCLIVLLLEKMQSATGASDIASSLKLITVNMVTPLNNFNSAIGDPSSSDPSTISISAPDPSTISPVNLTLTAPTTTGTSGDSSQSFLSLLNNIAATASTVAGAIKQTSGAVSGAILQTSNAVQTVGANTGSSAISLYMQRNGLTILIIGLLAIVLLIILTRVSK